MDLFVTPGKRRRDFDPNSMFMGEPSSYFSTNVVAERAVQRSAIQQEPEFSIERYEGIQNNLKNIFIKQQWNQTNQYFEQTVNRVTIADPQLRAELEHMKTDQRRIVLECSKCFCDVEKVQVPFKMSLETYLWH